MLTFKKQQDETYEDAITRYAKAYGLETEVLESFAAHVNAGFPEITAAFEALYEWDCLDFKPGLPDNEIKTSSSLDTQIMNIQSRFAEACDSHNFQDVRTAYLVGHRDARHAAADLAARFLAQVDEE